MDPTGTCVPVEPGKLFIGGISWETHEDRLKEYFEKYGEVSDCIIMRDPLQPREVPKHRGFGFVTFKDPASINAVLANPSHVLDNKKIDPKPATIKNATNPGVSQGPVKKIFIGGVAHGTSEDDVRMFFSKFGTVTEVDLKVDKATQRMRGFGFVGFDSEEVVEKLVQMHYHQINGKTVEVKKAEPRYATSQQSRGAMAGMSPMGSAYQAYPPEYRGGATNGAQYGQQFNYGSGSNYGYGYGQGMPPSGSSGYGNYPGYSGQYSGGYYDQSAYPSTQRASGDSRGVESGYSNYGYGQQPMTSYPQDASTYPGGRAGYGTAPEGYGQQTGAYSGEYNRPANQQQRGYAAAPPYR